MLSQNTSVIVSISFSNDAEILLVGKKSPDAPVEIVNAFEGAEARELWEKLTVKKEKNDVKD